MDRHQIGLPVQIELRHRGGARRFVDVLAIAGMPARVHIWWPLAGVYEIAQDGRLRGDTPESDARCSEWSVSSPGVRATLSTAIARHVQETKREC